MEHLFRKGLSVARLRPGPGAWSEVPGKSAYGRAIWNGAKEPAQEPDGEDRKAKHLILR